MCRPSACRHEEKMVARCRCAGKREQVLDYAKIFSIILFNLVIPLLSADYFASMIVTLFRGEQTKCSGVRDSHTAAGGIASFSTPDYAALICPRLHYVSSGVNKIWSLRDRDKRFHFAPSGMYPKGIPYL